MGSGREAKNHTLKFPFSFSVLALSDIIDGNQVVLPM
jgi:hypothetical protein